MTRWEVRFSGFGGQGIITAGHILGKAAVLYDKKDSVMTEAYGPERSGGWSSANVVVSDEKIDYPLIERPDILVAMSQDGYDRDAEQVKKGGTIMAESTLVNPKSGLDSELIRIDAVKTADELGKRIVGSIVMLGAFTAITQMVSEDSMKRAVLESVPKGTEELNSKAFEAGIVLGEQIRREKT